MYTRAQIIEAARSLVGVRYVHQGRSTAGIDCIGLLHRVASMLGEAPHDFLEYGERPRPDVLLKHAAIGLVEIPVEDATGGDGLLFYFKKDKAGEKVPQHFGIKTDDGTFIHAFAKLGKVIEQTLGAFWSRRVVKAYRFRGVAV